MHMHNWSDAKSDLTTAKNMAVNLADMFKGCYRSIAAFEKEVGAKLPKDIAAMLQPNAAQNSQTYDIQRSNHPPSTNSPGMFSTHYSPASMR